MPPTLAHLALRSHIVTGTVVLITGLVNLTSRKGGRWHRHCGKVYVAFMALVCTSAVITAIDLGEHFLAYLAAFVFMLAFSGWRSLGRKTAKRPRATWVDWGVLGFGVGGAVGLAFEAWKASAAGDHARTLINGSFAALNAGMVVLDVCEFTLPPLLPRNWWFAHMGKMVGSYIGALTAVVVVQFSWLPMELRYLLPPAVLVPLLFLWMGYYHVRFRPAHARFARAG